MKSAYPTSSTPSSGPLRLTFLDSILPRALATLCLCHAVSTRWWTRRRSVVRSKFLGRVILVILCILQRNHRSAYDWR